MPSRDRATMRNFVAVSGLACLLVSGSCSSPRLTTEVSQVVVPAPRDQSYVGSVVCGKCHAEIADRYAGHPMARSLTRIEPRTMIEDYERATEFARGKQRKYRVESHDGVVSHHEIGLHPDGRQRYDQGEPIAFAIGSGRRGRSYCLNHDGWLSLSPISWYSIERRWDLSPEYDPDNHPRFERPVSDRCLQCHAGRLSYEGEPTTEIAQQYRPPFLEEISISCERCHGPGGRHVERHEAAAGKNSSTTTVAGTAADDTIVNPAHLSPARADDVCNQCHLGGSAQVLRYGRRHRDFRPGDYLGDIWVTFTSGIGVRQAGETKAVSHVEQMQASRCYVASQGRLGCVTCHDPHEVPAEEARIKFFDGRCARCHNDATCTLPEPQRNVPPANGSCIACHMPRLRAFDVPHTTQTDHRILRQSPKPDRAPDPASLQEPRLEDVVDSWRIFEQKEVPLPRWEEQRARGLVEALNAEQHASATLARHAAEKLRPVRTLVPRDVEVLDALAVCEVLDARPSEAVALWEEVVRLEPKRLSALQSLMLFWMERGETTRAARYAERLLAVHPWQAEAQAKHSVLLERLGELNSAIQAAERAYALNPAAPGLDARLDDLYRRAGRPRPVRESGTNPPGAAAASPSIQSPRQGNEARMLESHSRSP